MSDGKRIEVELRNAVGGKTDFLIGEEVLYVLKRDEEEGPVTGILVIGNDRGYEDLFGDAATIGDWKSRFPDLDWKSEIPEEWRVAWFPDPGDRRDVDMLVGDIRKLIREGDWDGLDEFYGG
jgi:hypothetical protein